MSKDYPHDVVVTALTIYPVKSLKGIALGEWPLTPQGLAYDRFWMVVDENNRFVTQRKIPKMALIATALSTDGLILSSGQMPDLFIPLSRHHLADDKQPLITQVWNDSCEVIDEGADASKWLTEALQSQKVLRLVRMAPDYKRPHAQAELLGAQTYSFFADAAPYLVTNESSLHALNDKLKHNGEACVSMDRFRPNIVVSGLEAFDEHEVKSLSNQGYHLSFCYSCERCIVTTVDQRTAVKHPSLEPFNTLKTLNSINGAGRKPVFGENVALSYGQGQIIKLGDVLELNKKAQNFL